MATLRFFIFNLLGNLLPMLIALGSMPVIAHHAGLERLGVLAVVWTLVGYFGFLDFGLSRVVTRRVAQAVEQNRKAEALTELRGFFWWWALPAFLGIAILFLASPPVFSGYLPDGTLGQELAKAWVWIAWCLPVTLVTNWLRGALEGLQRFVRVNVLRMVFGSWTYAAPAAVALFTPSLDEMIKAIVIGRMLALLAHGWACVQAERGIVLGPAPRHTGSLTQFFREGGWMSVSNLVSPMMVYFDRFVLAAMLPAKAVAWYATSQEALLGARLIPGALAGVLFPQFAAASQAAAKASMAVVYWRGIRVVAAMMLPLCVLIAVLSYDGMRWWMGDSFAEHSYRVVAIIAVGLFVNSIAQLPFAWLQGVGRSRTTAMIHLIELPLYAVGLYFCVLHWGIVGAAWMWTFRVSLDCFLLLRMALRDSASAAGMIGFSGMLLITLAGFFTGPERAWEWRAMASAIAIGTALVYAWFGLLTIEDRGSLLKFSYVHQ